MSSTRQLEDRLRAWQGFCGIAGATRTLAAAQSRMWSEAARRAEAHRARCLELRAAYPSARPRPGARRVVLALGTDLGLCGPFNRVVAQRLAPERRTPGAMVVVIGSRLRVLAEGDQLLTLSAPTSIERVEGLATQLEALLPAPREGHLRLVRAVEVDPDGRPQVIVDDELSTPDVADEPATRVERVELVDPEVTAAVVASLARHARLVAALARSAACEAEARWRTMNRAHDAAEHRVHEQQRALARRRQELVTQEMLEARQGSRPARSGG